MTDDNPALNKSVKLSIFASGNRTVSLAIYVKYVAAPEVTDATPKSIVCGTSGSFSADLYELPSATSYQWSYSGSLSGPATTTDRYATVNYDASGDSSFTVSGVNNTGGCIHVGRSTTWQINSSDPNSSSYIIGSSEVCSSESYSISNLANLPNTTVAWSTSNSSLATVASSGNNAILNRVGTAQGAVTLTATISSPCGNVTKSKQLHLGIPQIYGALYQSRPKTSSSYDVSLVEDGWGSNYVAYSGSSTTTKTLMDIRGASNVVWALDYSDFMNSLVYSQVGNNLNLTFRGATQWANFALTITNKCGQIQKFYAFRARAASLKSQPSTVNIFEISPNPTSENAIARPKANNEQNDTFENIPNQIRMKVSDLQGNLIKERTFKKGEEVKIKTDDLKAGIYVLELNYGQNIEKHRLIVNH